MQLLKAKDMKITRRKFSPIYYVVLFAVSYPNILAIMLLDLNALQIIATTSISCIIGVTLIWVLNKHDLLIAKAK
jgi:hypothetical protein